MARSDAVLQPFPQPVLELGPVVVTDTVLVSLLLSLLLVAGGWLALRGRASREVLEVVYEALERAIRGMVAIDPEPLIPLVLTQWVFILAANLVGLVPGVASPTRDLSLAAALAAIAFLAGHAYAARKAGLGYLRGYVEPYWFFLPLNVLSELTRTVAMALRLFGNMLSATLVGSIAVYLAGFLVPVPLLLLGVLTDVVQAYIFGVLTLVFTASVAQVASGDAAPADKGGES